MRMHLLESRLAWTLVAAVVVGIIGLLVINSPSRILAQENTTVNICSRTSQVRDEILGVIESYFNVESDCTAVSEHHLSSILNLYVEDSDISSLGAGDFAGLTRLANLHLNGNSLSELPEDVFDDLNSLSRLKLNNNRLSTLDEDVFDSLSNLTILYLDRNSLSTLNEDLFDGLTNLEFLFLSYNSLNTVPEDLFDGLTSLKALHLGHNSLSTVPADLFDGLDLITLGLSSNNITTLDEDLFDGLTNLDSLTLNSNELTAVNEDLFDGLTNLTSLQFPGNDITVLPEDLFDGLSSLRELFLSENELTVLPADLLDELSLLEILWLNDNNLASLPNGIFDGLANLGILRLDGNNLTAVPDAVFDGLTNLSMVELHDNDLASLPAAVFEDSSNVTLVQLQNNDLSTLPTGIFEGLSNVRRIYLDGNQLNSLPSGIFEGVNTLTWLKLNDNPGAPLAINAALEQTDNNVFKVIVTQGAPFDLAFTLSGQGGTLSSTAITIAAGNLESIPVTVVPSGVGPVTASFQSAEFRNYERNLGTQISLGTPLMVVPVYPPPLDQSSGNSVATGLPTISGTAQVGQTLTASAAGIADANGLANATFSYQWVAHDGTADTDISGATSASYTLTTSEVGDTVQVRVSFTDDAGHAESLISASTATVTHQIALQTVVDPCLEEWGVPQGTLSRDHSWSSECASPHRNGRYARFYTFTLERQAQVQIDLTSARDTYLFLLQGHGQNGQKLAENDDGGDGYNSRLTRTLDPGAYTLEATTFGAARTGAFTLTLQGAADSLQTVVEPDLEVGVPSVDDASPSTQSVFTLSVTVTNTGAGVSEATTLRYYRSTDSTITSSDVEVSTDAVGAFAAEGTSDHSVSLGAPSETGAYYYGACVDSVAGETDTANNCSSSVTVTVPEPEPDLVVLGPDARPGSLEPGGTFALGVTVTNQGDARSAATTLRYKLSTDGEITPSDTSVGTEAVRALDRPQSNFESISLTAPAIPGTYYYGACVDSVTGETDTANNCSSSVAVTVILQPTNSPATGVPSISGTAQVGQTLTASATGIADANGLANATFSYQWVAHDGTADTDISGATSASYTLTTSEVGDTVQVRVSFTDDAGHAESLISASTATVTHQIALQTVVDPCLEEWGVPQGTLSRDHSWSSECASPHRNGRYARFYTFTLERQAQVQIDLTSARDTYLFLLQGHGQNGQKLAENDDGGDGYNSRLTRTLDPGAYTLEATTFGAARTGAFTLTLQGAADSLQTVVEPDLEVGVPSVDDASPSTQSVFTLSVTVTNTGAGVSEATTLRYYRSTDSTITSSDVEVSTDAVGAFAAEGTSDHSVSLGAPSETGAYYYGACVDSVAGETDTANNCSSSVTVTVPEPEPDLVVLGPDARPGSLEPGGTFALGVTVTNQGDARSAATTLRYKLSTDGEITPSDTSVGTEAVRALDRPQSNFESISLTAPAIPGTYYYGACVDSVTGETDTANNCSSSVAVTVILQPTNSPATGVPSISGTAQVGQTLTASATGIADADGLANATFSYQWVAHDGTADTDISGATSASYTLTTSEVGDTVQVRVSFTDDAGHAESRTSAATAAVASQPNRPATGVPAISGTSQVGETLTVSTTGIADSDGLTNATFTYRWLADDTEVSGTTGSTYTLVSGDQGKAIKVRVSFTDDAGNAESLTSAATATVAAPTPALTASAHDVPASHDGRASFTFELRFSEELPIGYARLRDHAFTVTGGVVVNARRLARGQNIRWEITVRPSDNGDVTVVLPVTTDCAATEAICTGDDRKLSNELTVTVAGPPSNTPATGAPAISGTAQVGDTLTASTSGIADTDGLENAAFNYQWQADGTDISGATNETYTLVSGDQGQTIRIKVSFTDDAGNAETLTSAATAAVGARPNTPATGAPAISGTAQVGGTLTASTSGIADTDGLTNATFTYRWLADDTEVSGAAGSSYTLVAGDQGKTIKVRVSFTDDAGNAETLTSAATAAVGARPNTPATGAPAISGTAQVGGTLTASTSGIADTDGLTNVFFAYQWVRNDGTDISGATASAYTLVASDQGKTIKVRVSFTDDAGNAESVTSTATAAVGARPNTPATGAPAISGTAQVGGTLTASTSGIADMDGLTNVSFAYQWVRNDGTDISGATASAYTLVAGDQGKTIKVRVSFTDDAGNAETLTSTATASVAAPSPALTASIHSVPSSHNGSDTFTFELRFSEEPKDGFSYVTLRDHAFTVTGGDVVNTRRLERGRNIRWEMTVRPSGNGDVTVVLPVTTDCTAQGAICTGDGRMLSNRVELTVPGPG